LDIDKRWRKRRKILKDNDWQYDRQSESYSSPVGSCDFAYDLKTYSDDKFSAVIEDNRIE